MFASTLKVPLTLGVPEKTVSPVNSIAPDNKFVPPIVIASASIVPSKSPSTASIFPLNIVAVIVPVEGL